MAAKAFKIRLFPWSGAAATLPLKAAWRAILDRHLPPADLAELGRAPLTGAEALALAKGEWKDAAVRNRKKIEWQTWAQEKYREVAKQALR